MATMELTETAKRCAVCRAPASHTPCRRCPIARIERREIEVGEPGRRRSSAIYLTNKIRLEGEIGRGGMGTVFCGVDETLDRLVAVKFLLPELQSDPVLVERFRREARATASIAHKNVVTLYSTGQLGGSDYFVAEYIDGCSVEHLIEVSRNRRDPIPVPCALWIADQMCTGLSAVHAGGVVHRDVKPGNFMVEAETGRVVIMDFGIGGMGNRGAAASGDLAYGTPSYMAPEAFFEHADADPLRARQAGRLVDVYSLGVTVFETLTGRRPFVGNRVMDLMLAHVDEAPPPPSSVRSDLPSALDPVLLRCLAKDPAARYPTVDDVREALASVRERTLAAMTTDVGPAEDPRVRTTKLVGRAVDSLRVVVADPDPNVVVLVQEGVRKVASWAVVQATRSLDKALDLARREPTQVLVAPLASPDLDGFRLAELARNDDRLSATTFILTTDAITSRERLRVADAGNATILLTPLDPEEVAEAVGRALSR